MVSIEKILDGKLLSRMRIISGKYRGKQIQFFKSLTTRPLKDSVKENIFNILIHSNKISTKIEGSNVLDLYSGIGSFGIECLSRKAGKVTFVEENNEIIKILKKNLNTLVGDEKAIIRNEKVEKIFLYNKEKFNIIFLDPPFADKKIVDIVKNIKRNKIFKDDHVVIIHREKGSHEKFNDMFNPLIIKYYGRSKIIFGKFF